MTTQQMEFLIAICKNKSFSQTAAQCYVSQSTVSAQISALEKEVGVVLIERTKNYVSPTRAGIAYEALFTRFLEELGSLGSEYGHSRDKATYLSVGILCNIEPPILTDVLASYHERFPNTNLRINTFNPTLISSPLELIEKQVDVLFTLDNTLFDNPAVSSRKILDTRFVMLVSGRDELCRRRECRPQDFADRTLLVPNSNADTGYQAKIRRIKQRFGLKQMHTEVIPSLEGILLSVACGLGVAIMNEFSVINRQEYHLLDLEERESLVAVWHNNNKNPNLRGFLRFLEERITSEARESG